MKYRKFFIRVALGLFFALLLNHFFFPSAGKITVIVMAAALVFFAYIFEMVHRREK